MIQRILGNGKISPRRINVNILKHNAKKTNIRVLRTIPLHSTILETNAPYFGRIGKFGSPWDVFLVAEEVAKG